MAGMKRLYFMLIALSWLTAALPAQSLPDSPSPADSSGSEWNNVTSLAHDEAIVVKATTGQTEKCLFTGAISTTLFCDPYFTNGGSEERFPRGEVEQVRLNQQRRYQRIVFWSFTAAGVIWGASDAPAIKNGTPRALAGVAGGATGALVGAVLSFPVSRLIPGKLVYHRSANDSQPSSTEPTHHFLFRSAQ